MKQKSFYSLLIVEAIVCLLLSFLQETLPNLFTTVLAFPFEQVGDGLRTLSLLGGVGNVIAIILYVVLCSIPFIILAYIRRKRKLYGEEAFLVLLGILLFVVLYFMINPSLLPVNIIGEIGKAILGGSVYAVLSGYVVFRLLRLFHAAEKEQLHQYLLVLLGVANVCLVYVVFGAYIRDLLDSFTSLRAGNIGTEDSLGFTYAFLYMQYLVNVLPYLLDIVIVLIGMNLLKEVLVERYGAKVVELSEKLSDLCVFALKITMVSNVVFYLLQLIFASELRIIRGSVQIPVFSIVFILAVLLVVQYMKENKQLKEDNDMFI